jgi:hypothetical protein
MYRDFVSLLTVTVVAALAMAAQLAHANAGGNPLHPQYYAARVNIEPVSGAPAADAGETRNPLHPSYAHNHFTGAPVSGDAQVALALYEHHNPLHPMFYRQ